jgi:hypothetical protein
MSLFLSIVCVPQLSSVFNHYQCTVFEFRVLVVDILIINKLISLGLTYHVRIMYRYYQTKYPSYFAFPIIFPLSLSLKIIELFGR